MRIRWLVSAALTFTDAAGCCCFEDPSPSPASATGSVSLPSCASARSSLPGAPATPPSLQKHLAATPAEASASTIARVFGKDRPIPQLQNPEAFFEQVKSPVAAGSLTGALVVCRVSTTSPVPGDSHLRVTSSMPGLPSVVSDGGEGASALTFSVPGLVFGNSDALKFRGALVSSKCRVSLPLGFIPVPLPECTESKQVVGSATMTYDGAFPLSASGGQLAVECRALDAAGVEGKMAAQITAAQGELDALCKRIRIDQSIDGFGWPTVSDNPMLSGVSGVAALAGWADPRANALSGYQSALRGEWKQQLGKWAADQSSVAPAPGVEVPWFEGMAAKISGTVDCGAVALKTREVRESVGSGERACLVRLEVRNAGPQTTIIRPGTRPNFDVVMPSGILTKAYHVEILLDGKAAESGSVELAPGKIAVEVLYFVVPVSDASGQGGILRALDGFEARLLRIR